MALAGSVIVETPQLPEILGQLLCFVPSDVNPCHFRCSGVKFLRLPVDWKFRQRGCNVPHL